MVSRCGRGTIATAVGYALGVAPMVQRPITSHKEGESECVPWVEEQEVRTSSSRSLSSASRDRPKSKKSATCRKRLNCRVQRIGQHPDTSTVALRDAKEHAPRP